MLSGLENIPKIPELKRRLWWTVVLLAVYRFGVHVPVPGINGPELERFFQSQETNVFGLFNLFTGGALERFSVFALGIMPYISASIILQLLTVVIPSLEKLQKEGEAGRRRINQYTRYATVPLSMVQAFGISAWIQSIQGEGGLGSVVLHPGIGFKLITMITLCSGTVFLMWLGEQITERGIGNGISLVIYAGIVARLPQALGNIVALMETRELPLFGVLILIAFMVVVVGLIVYFERAHRRVPVQYAKRVVGRRMYGAQSTYLPLKLNVTGVIPPIFASSLLMFPVTMLQFIPKDFVAEHPALELFVNNMNRQGWVYNAAYVLLIIFFAYFYAAIQFDPDKVADDMRRYGGYIPGIRPGKKTAEYLNRVLGRLTLVGGLYLAAICVLPSVLYGYFHVPFGFGGTSLLIVVGVGMDTLAQVETHLITRSYDGFLSGAGGGGRFRGRR